MICIALLFEWEASSVRDNSQPWQPSLTDLDQPADRTAPGEMCGNRYLAADQLGAGKAVITK
jgi:hypothetical protein